ncbi:MAG: TPR end-of-group domain-containing protein [Acidimicrobiia bacterium]
MGNGLAFRIAGIPVRIDPTFLLIALLLGFGVRSGALLVSWVLIVTGSVLLHELGHAVAFRRYGQRPEILLQGMGGLTSGSGEPLSPGRDIVVSLAGPLTGMALLGAPALYLARSTEGLSANTETILADLVFVNIAWSVLNLLPILPLDGGRVSAAVLNLFTGGSGLRPAHLLSAVVAGAGGLFALSAGYFFGALFAGFFAFYNISQLSAARNQTLHQELVEGWQALRRGDRGTAAAAAERALADRPSADVMALAMELLAWSRLTEGDREGARAALERYPHGREPDGFLLAAIELDGGRADEALDRMVAAYRQEHTGLAAPAVADAVARAGLDQALSDLLLGPGGPGPDAVARLAVHLHEGGRYEEATAAGQRAFDSGADGGGRVAYNLACSHARAGHEAAALDWLERATDAGFADVALLDGDPDLEPLRSHEGFRRLRARFESA